MANPHILEAAQKAKALAESKRAKAEKQQHREMAIAMIVGGIGWLLFFALYAYQTRPNQWRTDQPPVGHPYNVVTKAYVDKRGEWRSFDNGERIGVSHWTTNIQD